MPEAPRYGVDYPGATPLRVPKADKYGRLIASEVSGVELEYIKGLTSLLQPQIDAKEDTIALTADRAVISDGAGALDVSDVTAAELAALNALTASRALETSAGGLVQASAITAVELARLDGATEDVQPALDARLLLAGGALTGPVTYAPGTPTYAQFVASLQHPHSWGLDFMDHYLVYSPDSWVITLVGAGSVATSSQGRINVTTGALDNNSTQMQLGTTTLQGIRLGTTTPIWFEVNFMCTHASDLDWMVGLCRYDTTLITAGAGPGQVAGGIWFDATDGSANVSFNTAAGSSTTTSSMSTNMVANTRIKLGFTVSYNGSYSVTPYVNGTAKTAHTTNIPGSGDWLQLTYAIQAGSAAARAMRVDRVRLMQEGLAA